MCNICLDWEKERLTSQEAMRNLGEILSTTDDPEQIEHLVGLSDRILSKDVPFEESSFNVDEDWEKEYRED